MSDERGIELYNSYTNMVFDYLILFRLDFERFSITGPEPVNHQCDNDQFIVSGSNPVPVICGLNTGSHSTYSAFTETILSFLIFQIFFL